jgi:ribosome-binding protein aMBF1 (putative translation factor)
LAVSVKASRTKRTFGYQNTKATTTQPKALNYFQLTTNIRNYFFIFDWYCQNIICLMDSFKELIKNARDTSGLFLRQVAAEMEIDQAIISKFERGERKPTKEQVLKFAKFYELDKEKLLIAWLSDKVAYEIQNEDFAEKALKVAEKKVKYLKEQKLL